MTSATRGSDWSETRLIRSQNKNDTTYFYVLFEILRYAAIRESGRILTYLGTFGPTFINSRTFGPPYANEGPLPITLTGPNHHPARDPR